MAHTSRLADVRSHSALGICPGDPDRIVEVYQKASAAWGRTGLRAYASRDGGRAWAAAAPFPLPAGAGGLADPAVAWCADGQPLVAAVAVRPGKDFAPLGIAVYRSRDGGLHWGAPCLLDQDGRAHQPAAASDINSASPHFGRVYVTWCAGGDLRLAAGDGTPENWARADVAENCFCPDLLIAPDGGVLLAWMDGQAGARIYVAHSGDGGRGFSAPVAVAAGITSLRGSLPEADGWPHFPGANFRVLTVPAGVLAPGGGMVFAWADFREGVSRIYYRFSTGGHTGWQGPGDGQPLLSGPLASSAGQQEFLPRLMITPLGEVCCAFYEYGPKPGREDGLVDLVLAISADRGRTFGQRMVVTREAWNPAADAPAGGTRGGLAWLRLPE